MQWLRSLGATGVDWKKLIMIFQHEGRKVVIKGDTSLTKARVSLESTMRTWSQNDQGFLMNVELWKELPPHEATWENCDDFVQQFPNFHLEDKVILEEECNVRPPIMFQYSKRKKKENACHPTPRFRR
ncbi:ty3-gypsy retrotransposon protein [Cucumis melo var. makuwa]|uniref:Ty3-gypsy retrotransposon protein n=1 Tax=Cucumis melo var. makuwa TaxID=1194695 RepID=A0A5A7UML4_CUCMM|nr:ty3-gypsy retrotransposon protein [Cucumis melo var. makuwa]